jgi:hypothetical protein
VAFLIFREVSWPSNVELLVSNDEGGMPEAKPLCGPEGEIQEGFRYSIPLYSTTSRLVEPDQRFN